MTNEEVILAGGGSPQARILGPEAVRTLEDDRCPECGGIKSWDEEICEECQSLKNTEKNYEKNN
jgi:hypothetical protein